MVQAVEKLVNGIGILFRSRPVVGAGFLAGALYIVSGLNFITNALLARWLGPSDYGLVALVLAYPTLVGSFLATKSVTVTTRYIADFRAKGKQEPLKAVAKLGYGLDFSASVLAFLVVAVSGWWVSRSIYQRPELGSLMVLYAFSFPFASLTGNSWAILSSWGCFRELAYFQIALALGKLFFVALFVSLGFGIWGAVLGMGIAQAGTGVAMAGFATLLLERNGYKGWWRVPLRPVVPIGRELLGALGWHYVLVSLGGMLSQVPVMLLGRLRGPEEAGFYRLATSLSLAGTNLRSSLGRTTYPEISVRWGRGERESLLRWLRRRTLLLGLPLAILPLALIPFLPLLIVWIFGPGFQPMVSGAQVLMAETAFSLIFFWAGTFYYASGKVSWWAKGNLAYAFLVLLLSWFVIERWGFWGLAILVALSKVLFTLIMVTAATKGMKYADLQVSHTK